MKQKAVQEAGKNLGQGSGRERTGRRQERRKRMRADDRSRAEPQYSGEKECCILCGRLTGEAKGQPLSGREHYIEGAGQLCRECYQELYVPRHNGNMVQLAMQHMADNRFP